MSDTLQSVYDVRVIPYPEVTGPALCEWADAEGLDVRDAYRVEFHLLDCLFARVFKYDRNAVGELYCPLDHTHTDGKVYGPGEEPGDGEWCEAAERKPYDVPISSMPAVQPAAPQNLRSFPENTGLPPVEHPKSPQVSDSCKFSEGRP